MPLSTYCTDTDLLHWEPALFREAAFASQTLIAGTGNLADATFTISSGSFTASQVKVGNVIVLDGGTSGSYPVVAVGGATTLTLSVLYDALMPLGEGTPVSVGAATGLTYHVRTFSPQSRVVSELLRHAAGLPPTFDDGADDVAILNPETLRRPCVLGTLQLVYSALAAAAAEPAKYGVRADLYERLYRRALRNVRIELDLNGDGREDTRRALNVLDLERV